MLFLLLGLQLAGCASGSGSAPDPGLERWAEHLARHFDQITFGREFAAPVEKLSRWESPVSVSVSGIMTQPWADQIRAQLALLHDLTHLDLSISRLAPTGNEIHLLLNHRTWVNRRMLDIFPDFIPPPAFMAEDCKSIALTAETGEIRQAYIFIALEQPEADIQACIIEELAQSMGLFNDIVSDLETVFDDSNRINELSAHDRLMISALYDRRLAAGMTRSQALPIVMDVFRELLASHPHDLPAGEYRTTLGSL